MELLSIASWINILNVTKLLSTASFKHCRTRPSMLQPHSNTISSDHLGSALAAAAASTVEHPFSCSYTVAAAICSSHATHCKEVPTLTSLHISTCNHSIPCGCWSPNYDAGSRNSNRQQAAAAAECDVEHNPAAASITHSYACSYACSYAHMHCMHIAVLSTYSGG